MEEVIKRIIYIEEQAQRIIDSAEKEKDERVKELQNKLKGLKESLAKDAKTKVSTIREKEFNELKIELQKIEEQCLEEIEEIKNQSSVYFNQWVEGLVNEVLKR